VLTQICSSFHLVIDLSTLGVPEIDFLCKGQWVEEFLDAICNTSGKVCNQSERNDIVLANWARPQKLENKLDLPFFARDQDAHRKINEGVIEIW